MSLPASENIKKTSESFPGSNNIFSAGNTGQQYQSSQGSVFNIPSISLPKGGGAIRGIGEKFLANPVSGTASLTVPIFTSPGRSGFGPSLSLNYDSGAGNGPFGFGWNLALPSITRKTNKGIPQYQDALESDVFVLSNAEDLVPVLIQASDGEWERENLPPREVNGVGFKIDRYRPRIERLFARIERWTNKTNGDIHWRSISKDNILTVYGRDGKSRITDPTDKKRIFSWLMCESYDDKGNAIIYEYAEEDGKGISSDLLNINERNRNRTANRYIKRILYGNRKPLLLDVTKPSLRKSHLEINNADFDSADWMFEVVFDYDEDHYKELPLANNISVDKQHQLVEASAFPGKFWSSRPDPFSVYRSSFEVRTYRRCNRVLMFHHFPELGTEPHLVRSTEFDYTDFRYSSQFAPVSDELKHRGSTRFASFIQNVTQSGYLRDETKQLHDVNGVKYVTYIKKSVPPLEFEYSKAVIQHDFVQLDKTILENLPIGIDGISFQFVDLDGEAAPGILTEQAGAWFYKSNLGGGNFGSLDIVHTKPSTADLSSGRNQLMDLAGDGQLDIVQFSGPVSGFYERTANEKWEDFVNFDSIANIPWDDPNLSFVDLTGDDHLDILVTENEVFTWFPSLAEKGFGPSLKIMQELDEEKGPRIILNESSQSICLSDMSGDGLRDLVRIRNGEVCYWPNLGHGRFGAKVTMDNSPWFDAPDHFDQRRIFLADIDGSGVTDMIYLGGENNEIQLYFNQSGNRLSNAYSISGLPIDNHSSVLVSDFFGNGTACLVWSSPLPGNSSKPMRCLDLMGGIKPHLLVKSANNLGAETRVEYVSSTKFYLSDKAAGNPWTTRLPFPVYVIERVETYDYISHNVFVTKYAYHHGYFDGFDREFRGFGMVEQVDTEAFEDYVIGVKSVDGNQELDSQLNQAPVTIRTWFHTGASFNSDKNLHKWSDEYYQKKQHTPEPTLPIDMNELELRECIRALKGLPLRQEIYSFDGTAVEQNPYTVIENKYEVKLIQPLGKQKTAVFFPTGSESISLNYERNSEDPRISHELNLEVDEYGNVCKSCTIVYGREVVDASLPSEVTHQQQKTYVTYSEIDHTDDINTETLDVYRLRLPSGSRTYEITAIEPLNNIFLLTEIKELIVSSVEIPYETFADENLPQKRMFSHNRTLYLDENLNALPLGKLGKLGLVYEGYQLVFPPEVTETYFMGKITESDLTLAGYVHFNGDSNWWIPSGTALFPSNPVNHFFIPIGQRDPLGMETIVSYDQYNLLIERVRVKQAIWNEVIADNDYRILGPVMVTDQNKNRSAIETDALGMVIKLAIMGKPGAGEGDTLDDPTVRMEYELFNWINHRKSNFVHVFAREKHGVNNPRWQEKYVYSNGGRGVAMVKAKVHAGKALKVNHDGTVAEVDADPRWVGNGRRILNNKGNPVKQYEPYFSTTHEYEDEKTLLEIGVTPIFYYDPIGRNIRTLFPNDTFTKVEHNPWMQKVFDANDNVKDSKWYADNGSPDPATEPEPLNDPDRRAAWVTAKHANTPGIVHLDSLGRSVYAISDYGKGKTSAIHSENDLTGRFSKLFDQEKREVASGFVSMAGTPVYGETAEKGRRWTFQNVQNALVKTWDEHGREFSVSYDLLHRPVSTFVEESGQANILFNYIVYGDRHPNGQQLNLLGVAHQMFDQAGMMKVLEMDFKGNPKKIERVLAKDYKNSLNWDILSEQPNYGAIQTAALPVLESEVFTATCTYDALNRPIQVIMPDNSLIVSSYNEANFLISLQAQIMGQGPFIDFLIDQDYDAKGQRQFAHFGNEIISRYFYEPKSFRLANLLTFRSGNDPKAEALQNLHYAYDPVGNITSIRDDAQQKHFFNNTVVKPESLFEYDAIYHLILATGREHAGMINDTIRDHNDIDYVPQLPHPNNTTSVRSYTEEYEYDLVGNIKILRHHFKTQSGVGNGWKRLYRYAYEDDPNNRTNRLSATSIPGDADTGPYSATYDYDDYGNMVRMPHLTQLDWNFMDQIRQVDLGGGGIAYYVYGIDGQRVRKVIERLGTPRIERIYLGAVEIYRNRLGNNAPRLERYTIHISDNTSQIAQVDTKTIDTNNSDPENQLSIPLIRYRYDNHLRSAIIETNDIGEVISYEEYHPYGTSCYRSSKSGFNLSLKRYRFSDKELDDETNLYYFETRYYVAWLGRWTSSDTAGFTDGFNLYQYCHNSPIVIQDLDGRESTQIYELDPKYEKDVKTNTPEAKARIESALRGRTIEDNGVLYQINNPVIEWRGGEWFFKTNDSDLSIVKDPKVINFEEEEGLVVTGEEKQPMTNEPATKSDATSSGSSEGSPSGSSRGTGGNGGEKHESFITSSFLKGLITGIAVTLAVVAVVATAGAILAAVAPAASAAIASSGVGTFLSVAGGALTAHNTVQSLRQRDFWDNPISKEEADFNLGLGLGSLAGGSFARPVAEAGDVLGQGLGRGLNSAARSLGNLEAGGEQFALAGGGVYGGTAAAVDVAGVSTTGAVATAGTGMGTNVLMMSGRGDDDDEQPTFEKFGGGGNKRPRGNTLQNKAFRDISKKYGLTKDEERRLHDYIQNEDFGFHELETAVQDLFPEKYNAIPK